MTSRSNDAARRGARAIADVFRAMSMEARHRIGFELAIGGRGGDRGGLLYEVGFAVWLWRPDLATQLAAAIVHAVESGEALDLVATLPDDSPWVVIKAALELAIREGVDASEFPRDFDDLVEDAPDA